MATEGYLSYDSLQKSADITKDLILNYCLDPQENILYDIINGFKTLYQTQQRSPQVRESRKIYSELTDFAVDKLSKDILLTICHGILE